MSICRNLAPSLLAALVASSCTTIKKDDLRRSSVASAAELPEAARAHVRQDHSVLVLDLNENGRPDLIAANDERAVRFDITGNGSLQRTAWVQKTDGMLAFDLNGNGVIENATELFGARFGSNGKGAKLHKNGFAALQAFDANHDGILDKKDPLFKKLLVWRDVNGNAVSEPDELQSLEELGLKSLLLRANPIKSDDRRRQLSGSEVRLVSDCEKTTGKIRAIYAVWLAPTETNERPDL